MPASGRTFRCASGGGAEHRFTGEILHSPLRGADPSSPLSPLASHLSPLTLSPLTSHLSPLTSHLSPLTSPLTSHLSPLTSHLSPLTSHLSPLTSHLSPLTSHLSPLTSHPLTSHLSPLTSHLSPLTSHLFPHIEEAVRGLRTTHGRGNRLKPAREMVPDRPARIAERAGGFSTGALRPSASTECTGCLRSCCPPPRHRP